MRRRLDVELVRRGLAESRERARADIEAGRVTVAGAPATKPARLVAAAEPILVHGPGPRFVSRGGEKLDAALERFGLDVHGLRALDVGASTGGFTDCLLQRGAGHVTAVDVGYGQLDQKLRADPRVHSAERTNIRHVRTDELAGPFDLAVVDVSFISLTKVIGVVLALCQPAAPVVVLVKPQFEAGRAEVSRGRGVIRDPLVWAAVLADLITALELHRAVIMGCMVSPVLGADGNVEFVMRADAPSPDGGPPAVAEVDIDGLIAEALERQAR